MEDHCKHHQENPGINTCACVESSTSASQPPSATKNCGNEQNNNQDGQDGQDIFYINQPQTPQDNHSSGARKEKEREDNLKTPGAEMWKQVPRGWATPGDSWRSWLRIGMLGESLLMADASVGVIGVSK